METLNDFKEWEETYSGWDNLHPEYYEMFKQFAFDRIEKGFTRWGARSIGERMRWETDIDSGERYKVNNNLAAYFSRKFMVEFPEHDKFFETRSHPNSAMYLLKNLKEDVRDSL